MPIVGTLLASFIALLIAVPVSFGIAIYLTELYEVWLRPPLRTAIDMVAAIPSMSTGCGGC